MTIQAQLSHNPQPPSESAERPTLGLDARVAPISTAFALLDHGTLGRAVARALAPPGRYLVVEADRKELLIQLDRPRINAGDLTVVQAEVRTALSAHLHLTLGATRWPRPSKRSSSAPVTTSGST